MTATTGNEDLIEVEPDVMPVKMKQDGHRNARILSSVAATVIALSCGTNYGFSAWAPQFANKMHLSATQINLMGNFGNIGMYAMGIPGGMLIDSYGPRWGVFPGCIALAVGYFGLRNAYDTGPGSVHLSLLCFYMLCTGSGGCTAFSAAIKASASNWPLNRGTATAFPLSAFGLGAFFYTTLAGLVWPGDTSAYLNLLAYGTTAMTLFGMIFLRIVHRTDDGAGAYGVIPAEDQSTLKKDDEQSTRLHRTSTHSRDRNHTRGRSLATGSKGSSVVSAVGSRTSEDAGETSSLFASSDSSGPGDIDDDLLAVRRNSHYSVHSHRAGQEITGTALLRTPKFWQLFILLALLCGVGLMSINNIGNNARALWKHWDANASSDFIQKRQLMHVSILSLCSFMGRLASGIGSDYLIHKLHASRFWTLVASASIFVVAQCVGLRLEDPHHLFWLSGLTGLAYGCLFGVYPALVADAFGAKGLGINWGCMTWAPVISGNVYNLAYGSILDRHSVFKGTPSGGGERSCDEGRNCYASAYWITLLSSAVGVVWALWCIRQEGLEHLKDGRETRRDHEP